MGEQPSATPGPTTTPADSLAGPTDSLTDLRRQIAVMKGEIDALQIASAQAAKPWYRQSSVIIAVAALLFSMVSTYYANHLTTEQSKIASRSELGQLIQLLSALPQKDSELAAKYAGAPTTMITLRGDLAAESLVLAQQAADVIDRIPDQVSATEYLSVADPLVQDGVYPRARALIDRGLRLPSDIRTREGLLRLKGKLLFITGQPVQGGEQMQEALRLYRNQSPVVRAYAHALTESVWAGDEKLIRRCHEASVHISRAEAAAAQMGPSEYREQAVGQVRAQAAVPCTGG